MTNNYASDFLQLKPIPYSTARFSKDFVLKSIKQVLPFTISCDGLKKLMLPFHPIRKKSYSEIESNANLINDSHVRNSLIFVDTLFNRNTSLVEAACGLSILASLRLNP